jgi:DNA-binding transcriptional regulator YhcF (GntR family)
MNFNFTDRVRKVLAIAREEAIRLQHDYVGTEHILLGLVSEGDGVAAAVLTNLLVDLDQVQERIEESVRRGKATIALGELPYTSSAKKVLEFAMVEARELNHPYVGTEHLLLGLLREKKGIAADVLNQLGVMPEDVRRQTLTLLGVTPEQARSKNMEQGGQLHSAIDDSSGRSVHEQIIAPVIEAVATGVLRPGQPLPTLRQLADKLDVSPEIVAQAYVDLGRQGLIIIDPDGGTRIANRPATSDLEFSRPETLVGLLRPVAVAALQLGATAPELRTALEDAMRGIFDSPERPA